MCMCIFIEVEVYVVHVMPRHTLKLSNYCPTNFTLLLYELYRIPELHSVTSIIYILVIICIYSLVWLFCRVSKQKDLLAYEYDV